MKRLCLLSFAASLSLAASASRFALSGLSPAVYYDAAASLDAGSSAEKVVLCIHGWGGGIHPEAGGLTQALAPSIPVYAPLFPRRENVKAGATEDDGRAMWGQAFEMSEMTNATDWRGGGDAIGTTISSFDVIDEMLGELSDRSRFPNLRRIVLAGFSAGGQFVGRYVAVGKGAVRSGITLEYAVIAPSTELKLEDDITWHYGLKDRPRYPASISKGMILTNLTSRRVWSGCGTADVEKGALDTKPIAMRQGRNRYERFRNFQTYLKDYPAWARMTSFHDIPGVGHSGKVWRDEGLLKFLRGEVSSEKIMTRARAGVDLDFLTALMRIPSETRDLVTNNRLVDFFADYLKARGVYVTVLTNDKGRRSLFAATCPGKVQDYLFVSHTDVVPAMSPDQYEPKIEGDWLVGRGACDTKGNVAVIAQVLVNLVGKASVGAFIATDEDGPTLEKGKPTPQQAIDEGYLPRKMILVGDSAGEAPDQLFYAEKGHARLRLIARGKGGHSSVPWTLDNPVPKLVTAYAKAMEAMPPQATAEDTWQDCLSPTMLKGSAAGNQIPDSAEMSFSLRFIEPDGREKWKAFLERTTGLEVEAYGTFRLPVVSDPNDADIQRLFGLLKVRRPTMRLGRMSCATDASYYAMLKLPTVIFAATGKGSHGADERISISSLNEYVDVLTEFCRYE